MNDYLDCPECPHCGASIYASQDACAECEAAHHEALDMEADVASLLAYVEAHAHLHPQDALIAACDEACAGTDFDGWLPLYSAGAQALAA